MSQTDFAQRHRLVSFILIVIAFEPPVRSRVEGLFPPASLALVVHVWSYSAWFVLLGLQAGIVTLTWPRRKIG
ncbi:hypothetical protein, partial [Parasphingorhabdus sp.]|uniref:hypothetical protein n=1 Tax=Parasphingorhabdus sp. TaxID=2709688 RepID=UPI0030A414E6